MAWRGQMTARYRRLSIKVQQVPGKPGAANTEGWTARVEVATSNLDSSNLSDHSEGQSMLRVVRLYLGPCGRKNAGDFWGPPASFFYRKIEHRSFNPLSWTIVRL
jgi:hypothetical protein